MKFLKDPVWQFIGVIIAILAIITSVVLYLQDKSVKELQIDVLSNSPLISIDGDIQKGIQVFYKDKPVQTLSVILLKIENTGNEPIRRADYSEPISVSLSPEAEIGEVEIQETLPDGIPLAPIIESSNKVELAKTLLNPGDQAILKILALNNDGTLIVDARIVGISEIVIQPALENNTSKQDNIFLYIVFIGSALSIVLGVVWDSNKIMAWRKKHFGFDPANHYYELAQKEITSGAITTGVKNTTIMYLRHAFSWDSNYIQKAENNPLFQVIHVCEEYKELLAKYDKR